MKIHLECSSDFLPFLSDVIPTDTLYFYKFGSCLWLDMSFKKSMISIIYKGWGTESEGDLLLYNHETRSSSQIFSTPIEESHIQ